LMLLHPDPVVTADVILAPLAGSAHQDRLRDLVGGADVAAALAAAGWRVQGRPPVPGVPSQLVLPGEPGLPSPGALAALRAVVQEVAR
ncbi:MAG: hypothetical protein M3276_07875, partial [Actinomycetota bacterium]|nr:hypothetical protein [Actinomycetota bacterium]